MATANDSAAAVTPISTLRRRNSVDNPATLILHTKHNHLSSSSSYTTTSSSSSSNDYELVSLKPPSYTSLRDILPTTVILSPKPPSFTAQSGYEISIRNRLVKQAAWAYLQPMSAVPPSSTASGTGSPMLSSASLHTSAIGFSGLLNSVLQAPDCNKKTGNKL